MTRTSLATTAIQGGGAAAADDFQSLINASHDAIVTMGSDGRAIEWNQRAEEMFGWSRAEAIGQRISDLFIPPELREAHEASWRRRLASPTHGPIGSYELPARRRDGTRFSAEVSLSVLRAGTRFVAFIRDITESVNDRARQVELARANAFTELVIRNTGLAVATIGLDASFQSVNPRACEMLGYTSEELLTMTVPQILPPENLEGVMAAFAASASQTEVSRVETEVLRKDGSRRLLSFGLTPLLEGGAVVGFVGAAEDITERKSAQEALANSERLASLAQLAGGVAHDFNNLLTTILGNVAVIRTLQPGDPLGGEALEDIETAGKQAAGLARQMLAYAGKASVIVEPVDLPSLVTSVEPLLHAVLARNVEVTIAPCAGRVPCRVEADETQLRQVILNIALNAAEAIGPGGGQLTLSTGVEALDSRDLAAFVGGDGIFPGTFAFIRLADDGPGMEPEVRQRVFDPFFTTKFAGRGLGLSAVFGIVRGHRGALDVVSAPGEGATFTAYFPLLNA